MALKSTAKFHPALSPVECAPAGFSSFFTRAPALPAPSSRPTSVDPAKPSYPYTVHVPPSLRTQNVYGCSVPTYGCDPRDSRTLHKPASPWEVSSKASRTSNISSGTIPQRTQACYFWSAGAQQKDAAQKSLSKVSQAGVEPAAFAHRVSHFELSSGRQPAQKCTGGISAGCGAENVSERETKNFGHASKPPMSNASKREGEQASHIPSAHPAFPYKSSVITSSPAQHGRSAPVSCVTGGRPTLQQHQGVTHSGTGPTAGENQWHGPTGKEKAAQPARQADASSTGTSPYANQTLRAREGKPGENRDCYSPAGRTYGVHSRESTSSTASPSMSEVKKLTTGPPLHVSLNSSSARTCAADIRDRSSFVCTDEERSQKQGLVRGSVFSSKENNRESHQLTETAARPRKKVVFSCPTVTSVSAVPSTQTHTEKKAVYAYPTFSSVSAAASTPTTEKRADEEDNALYSCPTFSCVPAAASAHTPEKRILTGNNALYSCPAPFSVPAAASTKARHRTAPTPCFGPVPQTPQQISEAVSESFRAGRFAVPSVYESHARAGKDQPNISRDTSSELSGSQTYRVSKLQLSTQQSAPQSQYSGAVLPAYKVQSHTAGEELHVPYTRQPCVPLCPTSPNSIRYCTADSYRTGAPLALHTKTEANDVAAAQTRLGNSVTADLHASGGSRQAKLLQRAPLSTWRDPPKTYGPHSNVSRDHLTKHLPARTAETRCDRGVVRPVFKRTVHKVQTPSTGAAERRGREQLRNYAAIERIASAGVTAAAATAAGTLLVTASPALAGVAVVGVAALLTGLAAASATVDGPQRHRRQHVKRAVAAPYSTSARFSTQYKSDYPAWPRSVSGLYSPPAPMKAGQAAFQQAPQLASPSVASSGPRLSARQLVLKPDARVSQNSAVMKRLPDPQLMASKSYGSGPAAGTLLLMSRPMKDVLELKK